MDNNSFIYKIGYGSPEDSYFMYFRYDKELTKEQLGDHVEAAVCDVLELMCTNDEVRESIHYREYGPKFAEVLCAPEFEAAMNKQGFEIVRPDVMFTLFGWVEVFERGGWESYAGAREHEMIERLYKKFRHRLKPMTEDE